MCMICSTFNPFLEACSYDWLNAPSGDDDGTGPQFAQGDTFSESSDAAASAATSYSMAINDFFMGELSSNSDRDWVAVELVAGTEYTFAVAGTEALFNSNDDPFLTLRDASGTVIMSDDDGGPGRYSSLTFTATVSGTYYLDVSSWNASDSGAYGLSIVEGDRASFNAEMASGTLLRPDQAWTAVAGEGGATVTWAIRASGNTPNGDTFVPLSAAQIAATQQMMAYLDGISGLTFSQVNLGGTSNNATILFGAYSAFDGSGAYAFYPGGTSGGNRAFGDNAGNVWLNNTSVSQSNLAFGTYSYFTVLHEIGHAIGLAHPGDYNAALGVSITYANSAQYAQDTHQYTVMSYFDETNSGVSGGLGYPDTFMLHDYLAIHQLYGAAASYNSGDTVYGFNATESGSVYDFTANTTPLMSVYDGQGTDLIDLSGYAMAQFLSLQEGVMSDIGGYDGNFSIAYGAVIENAIGGRGNDTIDGNDANNDIRGGAGNDSILGGAGDDSLFGDGDADALYGDDGNDSMDGGDGDDDMFGGAGFDTMMGGDGNDTMWGELGNDVMFGGGGRDIMRGGNRNDRIYGEQGNDRLYGGAGNDTLDGGDRADFIIGGSEEDLLIGGLGNDTLSGGAQSDVLDGGADDDYLVGGGGFDTIIGGTGNDLLVGGFNADTFVFEDDHGTDIIQDFEATNDYEVIDFSNLSTLNSLADVLGNGSGTAAATQIGLDVVIDTGFGTITLRNVNYADLDANDFVF